MTAYINKPGVAALKESNIKIITFVSWKALNLLKFDASM